MRSVQLPLSIIVPVYQAGRYLPEFFESLEIQCSHGYELLLLDDGSTDDSLRQCYAYAADRPHVQVVDQGHHGVSYTRNNGIARAIGDYLLFLDADDMVREDTLADLLALLADHDVDVIIGQISAFAEEGVTRSYSEEPFEAALIDGRSAGSVGLYLQSTEASLATPVRYIVRRAMVLEQGLRYPDLLFEDEIWSAGIIAHGRSFKLYPKFFYHYRLRTDSRSATNHTAVLDHFCRIVELLLVMRDRQCDAQVVQFLEMRCQHLLNKISTSPHLEDPSCASARHFLNRRDIADIAIRNAKLVPTSYRAG